MTESIGANGTTCKPLDDTSGTHGLNELQKVAYLVRHAYIEIIHNVNLNYVCVT